MWSDDACLSAEYLPSIPSTSTAVNCRLYAVLSYNEIETWTDCDKMRLSSCQTATEDENWEFVVRFIKNEYKKALDDGRGHGVRFTSKTIEGLFNRRLKRLKNDDYEKAADRIMMFSRFMEDCGEPPLILFGSVGGGHDYAQRSETKPRLFACMHRDIVLGWQMDKRRQAAFIDLAERLKPILALAGGPQKKVELDPPKSSAQSKKQKRAGGSRLGAPPLIGNEKTKALIALLKLSEEEAAALSAREKAQLLLKNHGRFLPRVPDNRHNAGAIVSLQTLERAIVKWG
jgi:hypothetical protein